MTAREVRANLTALLAPNSVAITGATRNPEDLGSYILRNIVLSGYKGRVFPVNQRILQLYNFDTYSSIRDINEEIDLAIIATSADRVIDDVYDCTRAQVKNICIISRGFAEQGQQGLMLQKKIRRMVNEAGMSLLGPNSLGIISTSKSLNATFGPSIPQEGKSVFLSQSGALINAFCEYVEFYSLGLGEVIGLGNKADISEIDFLNYYGSLRQDGQPPVIGCYLENLACGESFVEVCSQFTKKIPLIALIPSSAPKTQEYIYSHTGSILQDKEVVDLALKHSGVLQVSTQQQLYDLMLTLSWQVLPRGNNIAVISNAGGGLVLAIDEIYKHNLKLVNLSSDVKKILTSELNWKGKASGVVDLGGEAQSLNYMKALDIILGDHEVNAVVAILSPQVMTDIEESAEAIGRLMKHHGKTVVAAFMGYEEIEKGIQALAKYYIPAFKTPDRAIYVLSKAYEYYLWREHGGHVLGSSMYSVVLGEKRSKAILEMIEQARIGKETCLQLDKCLRILHYYGLNVDNVKRVGGLKELREFARKISYPLQFYCIRQKKSWVIDDGKQTEEFFERHFREDKVSDEHRFEDHLARKSFKDKKTFTLEIQKDTYYEHVSKGFNIKELKSLSLGYLLELKVAGSRLSREITGLIPLGREYLIGELERSQFMEEFGLKAGVEGESFRNELVRSIQCVSKMVIDFPQILSVKLTCIVSKNKSEIVDCEIKLDLVV